MPTSAVVLCKLLPAQAPDRSMESVNLIFSSRRRWAVVLTAWAGPNDREVEQGVVPDAATEAQLRVRLVPA